MRLPTRMIRGWKTVTSTDGDEIVWIAVLDNGEFALCVDLPEQKPLQDLEEVHLPFADGASRRVPVGPGPVWNGQQADPPFDQHEAFPEPGCLTVDEQGRSADERYRHEREQMRTIHERRGARQ